MNILYQSFQKCKMGVDWKASIQRYEANLLPNLIKLRRSLIEGTYTPDRFVEFCCILSNSTRLQPSDVSVGIMHIIYPFGTDKVSFVRYTRHQPFCISFKSWTHIVVGIRRVVVVRIAIVVAITEIRRRGYQTLPDVNIYFPFSIFLRSLLSLCLHPFNRSTSLSTASRSGINLF